MQVPTRVFVADELPKGPTGKIQRRFMADAFMKPEGEKAAGGLGWVGLARMVMVMVMVWEAAFAAAGNSRWAVPGPSLRLMCLLASPWPAGK